ncbi:DNA mismatch repair ATPase msh1 [Puccinia graminis f. sp. tritici]|uniref:DNA mismatch repair ATPase msh1 n=1 Tax=Puccinia graminis f. sp. tritici TaxID=56615 RepID=A0A5B0RBG4_PUCGR|nr:DNA mismatch repair ATPase msh1 [Puccinia graminis f. sp. tritici]
MAATTIFLTRILRHSSRLTINQSLLRSLASTSTTTTTTTTTTTSAIISDESTKSIQTIEKDIKPIEEKVQKTKPSKAKNKAEDVKSSEQETKELPPDKTDSSESLTSPKDGGDKAASTSEDLQKVTKNQQTAANNQSKEETKNQQKAANNQPKKTKNQPKKTENQPKKTENQPKEETKNQQKAVKNQSKEATKNQQEATKNQQEAAKNQLKEETKNQQNAAKNQPKMATKNQQKAAENQPKVAKIQQKAAKNQPKKTENQPKKTQNQPKETKNQPKETKNQPKEAKNPHTALQDQPKETQNPQKAVEDQSKVTKSSTAKASNTPSTTEEATSQAVKPEVAQSLKPLPLPKTIRSQEEKAITTIDSDLIKFDQFVTIGSPPSQNPSMYTKKIAKFILDSRLRFPDAILLTCVGSFYEAYFDQAVEVAQLLNIKQAQYQFAGKTYPFSGFPIASLQKHLKTLVNEHNRIVAIAEQISTDEELERRIVRIITPGTITDENLIDDESYNYLLGIHQNQLAWLDVSTGSYFSTTCEGGESELLDQICRISPKEILISADSSFRIPPNSKAAKLSMLITKIKSDASISPDELSAEKLIGIYIKRNLLPSRAAIQPLCVDTFRHLKLDAEAIDSLEIIRTQNGKSAAGSLLSTISRTITRPGKRLLRDRIMSPSRVPAEIQSRLDLVGKLVVNHISREDIQDTLKDIEEIDYVRLLQRFNLGQGSIQDLMSIVRILKAIKTISSTLSDLGIASRLGCHLALEENISKAIDELTPAHGQIASEEASIEEAKDFFSPASWNVRSDLNKELSSMHQRFTALMEKGKELQAKYRNDFNSKDLKLQVVPKLGAVLIVNKARKPSSELKSKLDNLKGQTLIDNGSRVVVAVPDWTKMHASIEKLRQELVQAEQRVLKRLFEQVASDHVTLNPSFHDLAELDVAQSFATFAVETNCVRPSINSKRSTAIVNGRHPIAERALSSSANGSFIPNSIVMHDNDGLVQIITGPNNGGKSTYLRQLAIMHILAQAGSFVPAEKAKLGLVHQIFTRFGSFDNVVLGKVHKPKYEKNCDPGII